MITDESVATILDIMEEFILRPERLAAQKDLNKYQREVRHKKKRLALLAEARSLPPSGDSMDMALAKSGHAAAGDDGIGGFHFYSERTQLTDRQLAEIILTNYVEIVKTLEEKRRDHAET